MKWVCSVDDVACGAVNEGFLDKKKLVIAFHRRFENANIDNETLAKPGQTYAVQIGSEVPGGNDVASDQGYYGSGEGLFHCWTLL